MPGKTSSMMHKEPSHKEKSHKELSHLKQEPHHKEPSHLKQEIHHKEPSHLKQEMHHKEPSHLKQEPHHKEPSHLNQEHHEFHKEEHMKKNMVKTTSKGGKMTISTSIDKTSIMSVRKQGSEAPKSMQSSTYRYKSSKKVMGSRSGVGHSSSLINKEIHSVCGALHHATDLLRHQTMKIIESCKHDNGFTLSISLAIVTIAAVNFFNRVRN